MFLSSGIQVSGPEPRADTNLMHINTPKLKKRNITLSSTSPFLSRHSTKPVKMLHHKRTCLDLRRTLSNSNSIRKVSSSSPKATFLPKSDLRNSLVSQSANSLTRKNTSFFAPHYNSDTKPIRIAIDNDLVQVVTTLDKSGYRLSKLSSTQRSDPRYLVSRHNSSLNSCLPVFKVNQKHELSPQKTLEPSNHIPPTGDLNSSASQRKSVSKDKYSDSFLSDPNATAPVQKSFHTYSTDPTGKQIYTISVYNLHRAVQIDDVRRAFSQFGALANVVILATPSGMSLGQAHVSYYDKLHCQAAIDYYNNKLIDNLYIKIEHVKRPVDLQYTLSNMMIQNQQEGISKGTSFLGAGLPYPVRNMFPPPPSIFGSLGL